MDGGCNPVVTNNSASVTIPSLCTGGDVTVTWTVNDLCQDPTFNAVFTLNEPEPVTFTEPDDLAVDACTFADQAAVDARFNLWLTQVLAQANVDGGCNPVVTNNSASVTIPSLCTGGDVTVTWTVNDLCQDPTFNAVFTLNEPEPVTFTEPDDLAVDACTFADQAAVDARFNLWLTQVLAQANVDGGCNPVVTNNSASVTIPSLCTGGDVTVTWTVNDLCQDPTFNAVFTLNEPEPVTFTEPDDLAVDACTFADQAAVDARFNLWLTQVLAQANVDGGCNPVVTNNSASVTIPSLCTGGDVTVTWTVNDLCQDPTFNAVFTLNEPEPVTFTEPDDLAVDACTFADQAAVDARFNLWLTQVLAQANVDGGCNPVVTNNSASVTIPSLCTGGDVTVTWTVNDLCQDPTFNAVFTLNEPEPVTFTEPDDLAVDACTFADQAAVDARFNLWLTQVLAQANVDGGCNPVVTNNSASVTIPSLCTGGDVTVTWTVNDLCQDPTFNAVFTLNEPEPVTFTEPDDLAVDACTFADQAAVDARFNLWLTQVLAQANVDGGCNPVVTNNSASVTIPSLCTGGDVTVTWTVNDLCQDPTFNAVFTLNEPEPVTFTEPDDLAVDACTFADQAAVDARFNLWLTQVLAQANVDGGCNPVVTNNSASVTIPSLCTGGDVTVTWTVNDLCQDPTFNAVFTLNEPEPVTFTEPDDLAVDACTFADQAAVDARFNLWLTQVLAQANVDGGCNPVVTNNSASVTIPSLCTGVM